jgi:hypothetical protein
MPFQAIIQSLVGLEIAAYKRQVLGEHCPHYSSLDRESSLERSATPLARPACCEMAVSMATVMAPMVDQLHSSTGESEALLLT